MAREHAKEVTRGVDSKKVTAIEAKLAAAKHPKRIAALKVQYAAAQRVAKLRAKLHDAPPAKKAAIKAKLAVAKAALKSATKSVR